LVGRGRKHCRAFCTLQPEFGLEFQHEFPDKSARIVHSGRSLGLRSAPLRKVSIEGLSMTAWTISSVRVPAIRNTLLLTLALFSSFLNAQTISPQTVEFDPSPDHSRLVGGLSVVERYVLEFFAVGSVQPLQMVDLGKPNPDDDGKIRVNFAARLGTWPADGVIYEARVSAVGPGGSTPSANSNQFTFPGGSPPPPPPSPPPPPDACAYTVTPTNQGFNPSGGTGSVRVSSGSGCTWTATRTGNWITIASGANGTGNGTVRYRVSSNRGSALRTGTLTVAGQPVTITQAAATSPNAPAGLRIVVVR